MSPKRAITNAVTVGSALRAELRRRGLSQTEAADLLGVTPQAVSKWCNDDGLPSAGYISKIAKFLRVNIDELVAMMAAEDVPTRLARLESAMTDLATAQQDSVKLQTEMRDLLEQVLRRRR